MTDRLSDEQIASRIAGFDQQHAGACDIARVVAAQYAIYRDVGMPADTAASLAEMYLEWSLSGVPEVEDDV